MKKPRPPADIPVPANGDPPVEWVVHETLDRVAKMERFHTWLFTEIKPFLGQKVLEVGSGIGTFSDVFAARIKETADIVVFSDISDFYIEQLRNRYSGRGGIEVMRYAMGGEVPRRLREHAIDTVVALNVLEHVEDDRAALRHAAEILAPGGRLVLLVPALPFLYSEFDRLLGHHRRYRKAELVSAVRAVGLEPVVAKYFNLLGAFGWLISGKILRRRVLPRGQLRVYDALVPLLRRIERATGPPFGLSVLVVAEKPSS